MLTFDRFKKVGLIYTEAEPTEPHEHFPRSRSCINMMRLCNTNVRIPTVDNYYFQCPEMLLTLVFFKRCSKVNHKNRLCTLSTRKVQSLCHGESDTKFLIVEHGKPLYIFSRK
jgi:hypothetical protein